MPILLRLCRSESTHGTQAPLPRRNLKITNFQTRYSPLTASPSHAIISYKAMKETIVCIVTERQGLASPTESVIWKQQTGEHSGADILNRVNRERVSRYVRCAAVISKMRGSTTGYFNAGGTAGLFLMQIFPSQIQQLLFWDFFILQTKRAAG